MMFDIPLDVLGTFPTPNYDNPETRDSLKLWLCSGIFLSLATFCVAARLWARIFVRRWFGLDDLFIVLGFLCSIAVTGLVAFGESHFDWDRHMWDVRPRFFSISIKFLYMLRIFWALASSFIRFSVLCLYYRLMNSISPPRRYFWVLHAVTALNVSLFLVYILAGALPCIPIRAYWALIPIKGAKCINDGLAIEASGILNTFAEFLVALLPLLAVLRLRVNKPYTIIGLMSLGFFVCIVGCFRTYYLFKSVRSYDPTWWSATQWICAEIENNLALICACAVPLRPVMGRMVRPVKPSSDVELKAAAKPSKDESTPDSKFEFNQVHYQADPDEVAEWSSIVRNIVDLEGISDDGRAYTVTITGPDTTKRSSRHWFRATRANLLSLGSRARTSPLPDACSSLRIPLKTEVTIDESWRSLSVSERATRCGSSHISPSQEAEIDAAIGHMFPQYLGDSSDITPLPAHSSTHNNVHQPASPSRSSPTSLRFCIQGRPR